MSNRYKPQELAELLNLSPATIRKWASEEYGEFLSLNGQGGSGARRSFDEHDARIIAWVSNMKQGNIAAKDILSTLRECRQEGWKTLPALPQAVSAGGAIAVVPREAVEERLAALKDHYELQLVAIQKERDQLQTQLTTKQRELELKQSELDVARREAAEALQNQQKEAAVMVSNLQQRLTELSTKEAELRGRMDQYSIGGRRASAATLIVVALAIGALFTIVIIVLANILRIPG